MDNKLQKTIYTPDTGLRHPLDVVKGMLHDSWSAESRSLASRLVIRNFSAQFRQSLLGYFWLFLPPILNSVIFIFLNQRGIINIPETAVPYPLFVMVGNLLWQALITMMTAPIHAVLRERGLLTKLHFPREALLTSGFLQGAITSLIPLVLLPVLLLVYRLPLTPFMLLAPLGLMGLFVFAYAIGVLLTPLGCLYADVARAIPVLARFWMFVTPVIYALPPSGTARTVLMCNPATAFITTVRSWMFGQPAELTGLFFLITAVSLVALFCGLVVYRIVLPIIIERMAA